MGRPSAVFQSGQRHTGILAYAISKGVNRIEGVVGRILEIRRRERSDQVRLSIQVESQEAVAP